MGWSYTYKPKEQSVEEFFRKQFDYDKDGKSGRVIACAVKSFKTAYIAYEIKTPEKREVIAIVCLLDYKRNDLCNFGYKDMDECMGPCYYDCPRRILRLLTPTDNESARAWRKQCDENLQKREASKLAKGQRIKLIAPLVFKSGREQDTFRFLHHSTFTDETGYLYRIPRWKTYEFQVLTD